MSVCDSSAGSRGISVRDECLWQRLLLRSLNLSSLDMCEKAAVNKVLLVAVEPGAQRLFSGSVCRL